MEFWSGFVLGMIVGIIDVIVFALVIASGNNDYKPSNCTKNDDEKENNEENVEIM